MKIVQKKYISVISGGKKIVLNRDAVLYVLMVGRNAEIHLTDKQIYETRMSLSQLEEQLGEAFLEIHRGCIVATRAIHSITDKVYLSNGEALIYTLRKKKQIVEQLQEKQQLSLDEQNTALDHFSELVTQSNYDEALDEINHLLALDSANPQYYLKRAGLYVLLNRSDEAMADLETTIRLAPNLYDARQLRAQLLEENGKYAEARTDYETMYQIDPSQTDVLMYIADCYQQQMDY